jgi:Zn-dependent peptidase ImmA (M78 family)
MARLSVKYLICQNLQALGFRQLLESSGVGILPMPFGTVEVMADSIGDRVRALLPADRSHREIAASVGMTPDAFSRALNGQRGFSAIEIAKLADFLHEDVHYLITGQPDPLRLRMVARHGYNPETGRREVPGADLDKTILDDVALAYRQAVDANLPASTIPATVNEARDTLGDQFVRPFVDRLEDKFHVDVVRLADLSTSYSFTLSGRGVILVPADGNWFYQNWCLAHELGHLARRHTDPEAADGERGRHEEAADAFAAELLLPADAMRSLPWGSVTGADLAALVWEWGISTKAVATRLRALGISPPGLVEEWRNQPTQRLLRQHWDHNENGDPVTRRMDDAATRRFPLPLQEAHLRLIAQGKLPKATLAWMLGVAETTLEVDEPTQPEPMSADALATALGL